MARHRDAGNTDPTSSGSTGRPLLLGAVAGFLVGTVGFATEWAWTQVAMKLPWDGAIMPEALAAAALAGSWATRLRR